MSIYQTNFTENDVIYVNNGVVVGRKLTEKPKLVADPVVEKKFKAVKETVIEPKVDVVEEPVVAEDVDSAE